MMSEVIHELAVELNNTSGFTADVRPLAEQSGRSGAARTVENKAEIQMYSAQARPC